MEGWPCLHRHRQAFPEHLQVEARSLYKAPLPSKQAAGKSRSKLVGGLRQCSGSESKGHGGRRIEGWQGSCEKVLRRDGAQEVPGGAERPLNHFGSKVVPARPQCLRRRV